MRINRVFWGILLAAVGVILLLQNIGVISFNIWPILWALIIILIGVWILLGPILNRGSKEIRQLSIPLQGAAEAEVVLQHGAGRIHLSALQTPGELLSGTYQGGLETRHTAGTITRLELSPDTNGVWFGPGMGFIWNFGLNRDIPIRLRLEAGAGETIMDLSDLLVKDLYIGTGASSTEVTLPARASYTQVKIEAGVASVRVRVPDGVAANIHMETGLTGKTIDTNRFAALGEGNYRSVDYENAANRVDIRVEAGVGSIEIF